MQLSTQMTKLGPIWTGIQFLWSIKRIIAIISMLTALVYLMASETLEQRRSMLSGFNAANLIITGLEADLKVDGDLAFSAPSRTGQSLTPQIVADLYQSTQKLRSELATLSAPNSSIGNTRDIYVKSLTHLQGQLNLFEVGEDGTIAVLEALDAVELPAANYRISANSYQNSVWRSFWAAF